MLFWVKRVRVRVITISYSHTVCLSCVSFTRARMNTALIKARVHNQFTVSALSEHINKMMRH